MGIKIGNIDIGRTIVELEYQTKLNTLLINLIMNNNQAGAFTQQEVDGLKETAANEINAKYGKTMITAT